LKLVGEHWLIVLLTSMWIRHVTVLRLEMFSWVGMQYYCI